VLLPLDVYPNEGTTLIGFAAVAAAVKQIQRMSIEPEDLD
jgi:hypothetical protein